MKEENNIVINCCDHKSSTIWKLNLQPVAELDYEAFNKLGDRGKMTGVWLEHCQACSVREIASVFNRYRFPIGAKRFMNEWSKQGPAHHCAIGVGHVADKIEKLGKILR